MWRIPAELLATRDDHQLLGYVIEQLSDPGSFLSKVEALYSHMQEQIIAAQAAALSLLSTPLIPISDQVMVMPLIGVIDDERADRILETLLAGVAANRARVAIVDITGVAVVDSHVAGALLRAAQAVRLLGAQVVLPGIRAEVAQTVVSLDIHLGTLVTRSTVQAGIAYALEGARPSNSP